METKQCPVCFCRLFAQGKREVLKKLPKRNKENFVDHIVKSHKMSRDTSERLWGYFKPVDD